VLAGQLTAGSATLAPPFLSHQTRVVILALIPAVVVLGCAGAARWLRRDTVLARAPGGFSGGLYEAA
jgi:hypothetical protein